MCANDRLEQQKPGRFSSARSAIAFSESSDAMSPVGISTTQKPPAGASFNQLLTLFVALACRAASNE
jgi:hypothetical protein